MTMKNSLALVGALVFILLVGPVLAAQAPENTIKYTIVSGSTIVEQSFSFAEVKTDLEIMIPADSDAIEFGNVSFTVVDYEDRKVVYADNVKDATLKYISDGFIEKTKDRFFTSNLALIPGSKDITVVLPESASLKYSISSTKSALVPSTEDLRSDGKRIIIHWSDNDLDDANSLLVIYSERGQGVNSWLILTILIILSVTVFFMYAFFKKRGYKESRTEEGKTADDAGSKASLTRNLFEEEKAIVESLYKAKDHELWQKQLLLDVGISKVRLSRKLRSLESKGIIEKVPFGNTNKIRLKQV